MIILMSADEINKKTADYLNTNSLHKICNIPNVDFNDDTNDRLIALELSADGFIPNRVTGKGFAEFLSKKGMPSHITTIDLLISDVGIDFKIPQFAKQLADTLKQNHGYNIQVRFISSSQHIYTLLVPPSLSQDNTWQVYGIPFKALPKRKTTVYSLYALENKALVWSGHHLEKWLSCPERVRIGEGSKTPSLRISLKR